MNTPTRVNTLGIMNTPTRVNTLGIMNTNTSSKPCPTQWLVVPLPDVVKVKNEAGVLIFQDKGRIYRFEKESKQWKERSAGPIKIEKLLNEEDKFVYRILGIREKVQKVGCNQLINTNMDLKPMPNTWPMVGVSKTAWCWFNTDYSPDIDDLKMPINLIQCIPIKSTIIRWSPPFRGEILHRVLGRRIQTEGFRMSRRFPERVDQSEGWQEMQQPPGERGHQTGPRGSPHRPKRHGMLWRGPERTSAISSLN